MTSHTPSVLLDLATTQSGVDLAQPKSPPCLGYASTPSPLRVWLRAVRDGALVVAVSMRNVTLAFASVVLGGPSSGDLPAGAVHAVAVADRPTLHRLSRAKRPCSRGRRRSGAIDARAAQQPVVNWEGLL
jgi:hypothetical protein